MSQLLVRKYRSTPELYFEILNNIEYGGTKATVIHFKVRQQYNHTQKKLKDLIRMGMVTFEPETRLYFKTVKGEQYSQLYKMLKQL